MANVYEQSVDSGNTVYIMVNGNVLGRAQSLEGERSYGTEGVYEIGDIMPQEHVYLRYEGSITVNRLRMKKESLDKLGLGALGEDILEKGVIDIVVMDNLTNEVIIAYRGCTAQDLSETFNANEISTENATFSYLTAARVTA